MRFHPAAFENKDKKFIEAMMKTAQEVSACYPRPDRLSLAVNPTTSQNDLNNLFITLKSTEGQVKFNRDTVTLQWILSPNHNSLVNLCAYFLATLNVSVCQAFQGDFDQTVSVFKALDSQKPWFRISFKFINESGLLFGSTPNHKVVLNPSASEDEPSVLKMILKRNTHPDYVDIVRTETIPQWFYGKIESDMKLFCKQKAITSLISKIDESWKNFDMDTVSCHTRIGECQGVPYACFEKCPEPEHKDASHPSVELSQIASKPVDCSEDPEVNLEWTVTRTTNNSQPALTVNPAPILSVLPNPAFIPKSIVKRRDPKLDQFFKLVHDMDIDKLAETMESADLIPRGLSKKTKPLQFNENLKLRHFCGDEPIGVWERDTKSSMAKEAKDRVYKCPRTDCDAKFRTEMMRNRHAKNAHDKAKKAAERKAAKAARLAKIKAEEKGEKDVDKDCADETSDKASSNSPKSNSSSSNVSEGEHKDKEVQIDSADVCEDQDDSE
ncbi:hypothetical protein L596_010244 [Steinernema carpocapsae]|uniref:C2H2-type domain-containing protein n=1 Tax=Steinernema carpocapsae TaxID=34508 RepID=A0A4U5PHS3_STECR|nr:hypothetical protein L596_010244 [Steinernema carpocapsae]